MLYEVVRACHQTMSLSFREKKIFEVPKMALEGQKIMKKRVFWLFLKNWPNDLADFSLYTVISYGKHDGISRFARKNRSRPQNGFERSKKHVFCHFFEK